MPCLILGKPTRHHHASSHKRQHVAINLDNRFNSDGTTVNELEMAKEEDEMIKSRLLPNMKDMDIQREQARQEQNSGLKYPLSSAGSDFSPVESVSKKFFDNDSQNFWIGNNNKKANQDEDQYNNKMVEQQRLPLYETTNGVTENAKFIKNDVTDDENGKDQQEPTFENVDKKKSSKDEASKRDSFHDSEEFDDGFKTDEDEATPDNELSDPKANLHNEMQHKNHHHQYNEEDDKVEGEMKDSSKRFSTDDGNHEHAAGKPDSQISDVLKSVFGQGDSQFPMQREQYF